MHRNWGNMLEGCTSKYCRVVVKKCEETQSREEGKETVLHKLLSMKGANN